MKRSYTPVETGMLTGLVVGMLVGVLGHAVTGQALWISFAPPIGLLVGVAVGQLRSHRRP